MHVEAYSVHGDHGQLDVVGAPGDCHDLAWSLACGGQCLAVSQLHRVDSVAANLRWPLLWKGELASKHVTTVALSGGFRG